MWHEDTIGVPKKEGGYMVVHYWVKAYDEGSQYGIDGGRISKLMIKRQGDIVCNYDRGWDVEPVDEDTQLALEIILHTENH